MALNTQLFQKLNELLAQAQPTKIIKRGNAFSFVELTEPEAIQKAYSNLRFIGLNIYGSSPNSLSGECYFENAAGQELDFETRIRFISLDNIKDLKINEFELNLPNSEVFLEL